MAANLKYTQHIRTIGQVSITLLTPEGFANPYSMVKQVAVGDRIIFKYDSANYIGAKPIVRTHERGEELYALTIRDRTLIDVYPLAGMAEWKMVAFDGKPIFEGRKIVETVTCKREIAEELGLIPEYSAAEKKVLAHLEAKLLAEERERQKAREEAKARRLAEEEAKRQEAARKRAEEIARIMGRPRVRGFSPTGMELSGIPVVDDEWRKLKDGTFCVTVESYNDETGVAGTTLEEHFMVEKTGSGRTNKVKISRFLTTMCDALAVKIVGSELVKVEGELREVHVYTPESLAPLLASGLNGGAVVGVATSGSEVQLYRFGGKSYKTFGNPIPRTVAE